MRAVSVDNAADVLDEQPHETATNELYASDYDDFNPRTLERLGSARPSWALLPGQRSRAINRRHDLSVEDIGVDAIAGNAEDDEEAEHLLWLTRRTLKNRDRHPDPIDDPFLSIDEAGNLEALRAPRNA